MTETSLIKASLETRYRVNETGTKLRKSIGKINETEKGKRVKNAKKRGREKIRT